MPTEYPLKDGAPEGHQARVVGRRQLLKTLATVGGTVTASTLLPGRWIKPAVEVGLLPAHAQVSPTPTPTPSPTPTIMCYTPTPLRCYTVMPSDTSARPSDDAQPASGGTPEARRLLLEQLLAEGRFPQDIARNLQ